MLQCCASCATGTLVQRFASSPFLLPSLLAFRRETFSRAASDGHGHVQSCVLAAIVLSSCCRCRNRLESLHCSHREHRTHHQTQPIQSTAKVMLGHHRRRRRRQRCCCYRGTFPSLGRLARQSGHDWRGGGCCVSLACSELVLNETETCRCQCKPRLARRSVWCEAWRHEWRRSAVVVMMRWRMLLVLGKRMRRLLLLQQQQCTSQVALLAVEASLMCLECCPIPGRLLRPRSC